MQLTEKGKFVLALLILGSLLVYGFVQRIRFAYRNPTKTETQLNLCTSYWLRNRMDGCQ